MILLLILAPAFAQESTPEPVPTEPIPTFTETPSLTPSPSPFPTASETPVPTWTPTASETATPSLTPPPPTVEVTAEITPELTPEITPEITSQPTATAQPTATTTPLPSLSLLYSDAFDDYNGGAWFEEIYSMLVPDGVGTGNVVQFSGYGDLLAYRHGYLDDTSVSARFAFEAGTLHVYTRHTGQGYYDTAFNGAGHVELWKVYLVEGQVRRDLLGSATVGAASMTWRTLTTTVIGGDLRVTVDGTMVITATDAHPLQPGTLSFRSDYQQTGPFWMDDLALYGTQRLPSADTSASPAPVQEVNSAGDASDGRIIYRSNQGGSNDIWAINADPTNPNQANLTSSSTLTDERDPQWAADGQKIVYTSNSGGGSYQMFAMNPDGSSPQALPVISEAVGGKIFAPTTINTGKISYRNADATEIRLYDIGTSTTRTLAHIQDFLGSWGVFGQDYTAAIHAPPVWSPNGTQVAFSYRLETQNCGTCWAQIGIILIDSATGNLILKQTLVQQSNPAFPVLLAPIIHLDWSPDGTKLVTRRAGTNNFFAYAIIGPSLSPIGSIAVSAGANPTWSPDSNHLASVSGTSIRIVPLNCNNTCTPTVIATNALAHTLDWGGSAATPQPTPTPTPVCGGGLPFDARADEINGILCQGPSPTPNVTPTPGLMPDDDCSNGTIDLISLQQLQAYASQSTQVLIDLNILVPNFGLVILENPTINSKAIYTNGTRTEFPWGQNVRVFRRIEFPQILRDGNNPPINDTQVWYEVGYPQSETAVGWVPARYNGNNFTLGSDPCAGNANIGTPTTLTFSYDRRAAANYAIEHSYQNWAGGSPAASGRVTLRLTNPRTNASGTPVPYVPYANFDYSGIVSTQGGSTGSAVFISESIWAGGLPMTIPLPPTPDPPCESTPDPDIQEGWSYCLLLGGTGTSNPWDFHEQLIAYFTLAKAPDYYNQPGVTSVQIYSNDVLPPDSQGIAIEFPGTPVTQQEDRLYTGREVTARSEGLNEIPDPETLDMYQYIPVLRNGIVSDSSGLAQFIAAAFGQNNLRMGDYVFINPILVPGNSASDTHGLLIVGWGPIQSCSRAWARSQFLTIDSFYTTRTEANSSGIPDAVPYVADFTGLQQSTARPFYCTMVDAGNSRFNRHDWYFYTLPDTVTIPVSQLYIDLYWNWN